MNYDFITKGIVFHAPRPLSEISKTDNEFVLNSWYTDDSNEESCSEKSGVYFDGNVVRFEGWNLNENLDGFVHRKCDGICPLRSWWNL